MSSHIDNTILLGYQSHKDYKKLCALAAFHGGKVTNRLSVGKNLFVYFNQKNHKENKGKWGGRKLKFQLLLKGHPPHLYFWINGIVDNSYVDNTNLITAFSKTLEKWEEDICNGQKGVYKKTKSSS